MRHPYVGDVGDFGKYGLLRALSTTDGMSLGVVWYLTDCTEHNNDGKHDGYLKGGSTRSRALFRDCDPELYERMAAIRNEQQLSIEMVQDGSVLPKGTVFFGTPVPAFQGRATGLETTETRWKRRDEWHSQARIAMCNANLVFTDPDNGISFDSQEPRGSKPSHKHSYWTEINDYLENGKCVVAYHHLGRQHGGHLVHIRQCLARIRRLGFSVWAVHYRRGTARAFFIIPNANNRQSLLERSRTFAETWRQHAALVEH